MYYRCRDCNKKGRKTEEKSIDISIRYNKIDRFYSYLRLNIIFVKKQFHFSTFHNYLMNLNDFK